MRSVKKKMKPKYIYVVRTAYGDTETVEWAGDGWLGHTTGRKYDENEFISYTKVKDVLKEKENVI